MIGNYQKANLVILHYSNIVNLYKLTLIRCSRSKDTEMCLNNENMKSC